MPARPAAVALALPPSAQDAAHFGCTRAGATSRLPFTHVSRTSPRPPHPAPRKLALELRFQLRSRRRYAPPTRPGHPRAVPPISAKHRHCAGAIRGRSIAYWRPPASDTVHAAAPRCAKRPAAITPSPPRPRTPSTSEVLAHGARLATFHPAVSSHTQRHANWRRTACSATQSSRLPSASV